MNYVWYVLAALAACVLFGWLLSLLHHRVIDWRENRWPKQEDWQTTTGSMFALRQDEPRSVADLGSFFADQNQPAPQDPWNGVESWSVDHGFRAEDKLDVIKAFARVGYDEVPTPAPLPVETVEPALLWNDVTSAVPISEYRVESPTEVWRRAGHDPSTKAVKAANDPNSPEYKAAQEAIDRLNAGRKQSAFVPAQRDGDEP